MDFETETLVAHSLRGGGFDASEDGTGRGTPLVPVSYAIQAGALRENPSSGPDGVGIQEGHTYTLEARAEVQAVAYRTTGNDGCYETGDVTACLNTASDPNQIALLQSWRVRRLMPIECERLQGFTDDYTAIPYRGKTAADGPRYKALGNSMAVNVMRWIGTRIEMVERITGAQPPPHPSNPSKEACYESATKNRHRLPADQR